MLRILSFVAAFAVLSAEGARAEIIDLTGEVWSVCGWDGSSTWDETRLVFTSQIGGDDVVNLEGYFDWRSSRGSVGREHFQGILTPNGEIALQGASLHDSQDIVTSRYRGRLTASGATIVDGVWLDGVPGVWAAVRDGGSGTASGLCNSEDQLV
ncbi:MAG: hypothetical protein ABJ327_14095 [Litoreibacter sp.]